MDEQLLIAQSILTSVSSRTGRAGGTFLVNGAILEVASTGIVTHHQVIVPGGVLKVYNCTAKLLRISPHQLCVMSYCRVEAVALNSLTVEPWIGDLVIPVLSRWCHGRHDRVFPHLCRVVTNEHILSHFGSVQLGPLGVMSKTALISPSLSYFLQFCVPHLEIWS